MSALTHKKSIVYCVSCGAKKYASIDAPSRLLSCESFIEEIKELTHYNALELKRAKVEIAPSILELMTKYETPLRELLKEEFVCSGCKDFVHNYPIKSEGRFVSYRDNESGFVNHNKKQNADLYDYDDT